MKVIIHIGQQKTGSTVLQDYLFQSRSFLKKHNILYPQSLGHKKQVKLLSENTELSQTNSSLRESFTKELCSQKFDTVIISEENLFAVDEQKISNVKNLITQFSDDVVIFAYLRRQDDHLLSIYQQGIRGTRTNTLEETITKKVYNNQHDYEKIINRWAKIFNNAKINLRPYIKIKDGSVVNDFKETFRLPSFEEYQEPSLAVSNKSFDAASIEFIRIMNELEKEGKLKWDHSLKRKMRVYLKNKQRNKKLQLSSDDVLKIKEQHNESNSRLAQKYNNNSLGAYLTNFPTHQNQEGYYNEDVEKDMIYELYFNVFESLD